MPALSLIRADFGPPPPVTTELAVPGAAPADNTALLTGLAGYVQDCFIGARDHRQNQGIDDRMLNAMRSLRGEYDSAVLADIKKFGGSDIYARITASKVRGCSSLLREIYSSTTRPWALSPTPEPALAGATLAEAVTAVLQAETAEMWASAQTQGTPPPTPDLIMQRAAQLRDELLQQRKKQAEEALRSREATIDDVLWEGGFYEALWEFLGDIATFPYAVVKGPVVRFENQLVWKGNVPGVERKPKPRWDRCSPFDIYFAPWSQRHQDGFIVHRERISRAAIQSMKGLPNYNDDAIDKVLADWNPHNCSWYNYNETERADLEQRESEMGSTYSADGNERPMPMLSFYGSISVDLARGWGVSEKQLPKGQVDDINVFVYLVGREVIGVTVNPHPTGKLPFYVDCFERVPGSPYGNAIPDLLEDVQGVGNAALRALVNNLAIASGPMGWMNEDRLAENDPNASKLWPWKIFRFTDPASSSGTEEPMKFFQPDANVQQLMMVYERFLSMADELSTIPRYMQGSGSGVGGAGRTAAGLSMLMEASNRTIKQTVTSIDHNVVEEVVEDLNVYLALTRKDVVMAGDISVVARGAVELMQKETLRMRRMEYLNITNNPIDQLLVGPEGRWNILRDLARDLGMPVSDAMPIDENAVKQLNAMMLQQAMGMGQPQPGAQQGQPPTPQANPAQGMARSQENSPR